MKDFMLDEVLFSLQSIFETLAEEKGLSLIINNKAGNLALRGDALRLTQVLNNLLGNALKFTSKGSIELGVTTIEDNADQTRLEFFVKDSGIGMAKNIQDKLFTAFTQADSSTTRQFGGTGLGLSICKQLVELMGGKISVESHENEGSTFYFNVRFAKGDTNAVHSDEKHSKQYDFHALKLLVAEDNMTNQLVVQGMLEEYVGELVFAKNGQEAVERMNEDIDLILMDIQMPVMGGIEASHKILEQYPHIPIIALTANAMKEDIAKTRQAGMIAHVTKPIDIQELLHTIEHCIKGAS